MNSWFARVGLGVGWLTALSGAAVLTAGLAVAEVPAPPTVPGTTHCVNTPYLVSFSSAGLGADAIRVELIDFAQQTPQQPRIGNVVVVNGIDPVIQWIPTVAGHHEFAADVTFKDGSVWGTTRSSVDVLDASACGGTTPPTTTTTPPSTTTTPPPTTTTPVPAAWQQGLRYNVGDVVSYNGSQYRCIQAHTADAPDWTPPNTPALWQKI
ncbi:hypothetical protein JMUB6875_55110 [Nocardia sp. JMUB6875]|uniref:carbohydrate-binding protein n=1 Tax=Nocardia sp. JMUB6875 TaxID=3158170 RepID=UPI0032E6D156